MEYTILRKQYTDFYYKDYTIEESDEVFKATFHFEIPGLTSFSPSFTLKKPNALLVGNQKVLKEAVFSLGMVELISYWKTCCPPKVHICCNTLDELQIAWWKKLYFNGLGEFFYTNGIETSMEDFMEIIPEGNAITGEEVNFRCSGNLIPVGGGKDSFVTLDLVKEWKKDNCAFVINKVMSAIHSANAAGYRGDTLINPVRTLDKNMLDLNKQGFLNGHTPFSAMCAFACYVTAIIYHKKYIALSNESSANESTVKGSNVNHQYSKTFEFEKDFNWYTSAYMPLDIHYFSFLRPLSELQIAGLFSKLKPYHSVFRSCNVGSKEEKWCGHCAKCLFVYILMSAYLPSDEVAGIFGRDMLNDPEMKELFEQLSGLSDNKPFECVGTRDEVNIAVAMGIRKYYENHQNLPYLYAYYITTKYYAFYKDSSVDWKHYDTDNMLPDMYDQLLKEKLQEQITA